MCNINIPLGGTYGAGFIQLGYKHVSLMESCRKAYSAVGTTCL